MSEYGVGRAADASEEPVSPGGGEPAETDEVAGETVDDLIEEPVEEYAEPYADPQEWISGLVAKLERAEQGIGSGPRDVLMARIKLAQAYSELGDTVQAAPLAVANVAQAMRLFPSSEGMLRQLREFRNAACEAAGWTAAMMREPDEDELAEEEPSELVARPDALAESEPVAALPAQAEPADELTMEAEISAPEAQALAQEAQTFAQEDQTPASAHRSPEPEPAGAVIHEFVRRAPEPDALQWAAEVQAALTQPAEIAIPSPPEPEYAEEVEPALASADLADISDLADLAAIEEIIKLRYELREAQRTIERLRHVNRKLREALEFDEAP
jgi:hypothetical protein